MKGVSIWPEAWTEPEGVHLDRVTVHSQGVTLELTACRNEAPCPHCCQLSHQVHSHYRRTLADLPFQGQAVRVVLHSRRFFCTNGQCSTRIFTERLPELVAPYARRTQALHQALHLIGLALGGRAGAALAHELQMSGSRDTLLRSLRRWVSEPSLVSVQELRVVGIDDWAFRRGQRYGTIICDLERHRVVDLLPERDVQSTADWLRAHPKIQIISRDRGGTYAEAARIGAPQAVQVADRWHLLNNLGQMVQQVLQRHYKEVRQMERSLSSGVALEESGVSLTTMEATDPNPTLPERIVGYGTYEAQRARRRERRVARYEEVVALHRQGLGSLRIARRLQMSPVTVRRHLHAGAFPEHAPKRTQVKEVDAYRDYLFQRWKQGARNGMLLWREIREQGFTQSSGPVYELLKCWQNQWPTQYQASVEARGSPRPVAWTYPRHLMWLLLYPERTLARAEKRDGCERRDQLQTLRDHLLTKCPALATLTQKSQEFIAMIKGHQAQRLSPWIEQTLLCGEPGLAQFAKGLQQDYEAVHAALQYDWSQGPVEGQVNRLKFIKRQMYGRARFDLLRLRVCPAALPAS